MSVSFDPLAWESCLHWQKHAKTIARKINALIKACQRHPFEGPSKPEPLKRSLSGFWSRCINRAHQQVYRVEENSLKIAQCRYHD